MLTNTEYAQMMENLVISTTSSPPSFPIDNLLPTCGLDSGTIRVLDFSSPNRFMTIRDEEIIKLAKNGVNTKLIQHQLHHHGELRQRLHDLFTEPTKGKEYLLRMATDNTGNFLIQELLASENRTSSLFIHGLEEIASTLALNRYGCRVLQKLVQTLPPHSVEDLMNVRFAGIEFQLITDQNGNHIVQYIVNNLQPQVYLKFIESLNKSVGLKQVVENKYGCRVLQCALEKVILICHQNNAQQRDTTNKSAAYEILHLMISTVLQHARSLAEQEFGNYIVQAILKDDFLARQRSYIIKHHFMSNILELSQGKYSSHVIEVAISHADEKSLEAIFFEVFGSYDTDKRGQNALHIMLFHQYGNYVVQRMLEVAIQVRLGQRCGDQQWFDRIVTYAFSVGRQLSRYSSGKKVLETIKMTLAHLAPPLLQVQMPQPLPQY
uniref:PUM-HD domain-containing protein n=1 Tax=Meloidogyne incognita TaxID=6306 RepID=A0A914LNL4_MELIC